MVTFYHNCHLCGNLSRPVLGAITKLRVQLKLGVNSCRDGGKLVVKKSFFIGMITKILEERKFLSKNIFATKFFLQNFEKISLDPGYFKIYCLLSAL